MKTLILLLICIFMSACSSVTLTKEPINDDLKQLVEYNKQLREDRINLLLSR